MKNRTITVLLTTVLVATVAVMVAFSPITHAEACPELEEETVAVNFYRNTSLQINLRDSKAAEYLAKCDTSEWSATPHGVNYFSLEKKGNTSVTVTEVAEGSLGYGITWDSIWAEVKTMPERYADVTEIVVEVSSGGYAVYRVNYKITLTEGTAPKKSRRGRASAGGAGVPVPGKAMGLSVDTVFGTSTTTYTATPESTATESNEVAAMTQSHGNTFVDMPSYSVFPGLTFAQSTPVLHL